MCLPSDFGEFWPDGEFEYDAKTRESGWNERLRLHYLAQTPDEQRRLFDYGDKGVGYGAGNYASYVVGKFISEPGALDIYNPEWPLFSQVESHEAPRLFKTEKTYKSLGSLIKFNDRIIGVDECLKAVIERWEPSKHQYFP